MPAEIKYPYQVLGMLDELMGEHWWEEHGPTILSDGVWSAVRDDGGLTNSGAVAAHIASVFQKRLMERLEYTDDFAMQARFFVNEYLTNQGYGGPEEGGWWYPVGRFVKCHGEYPTSEEAKTAVASLQEYLEGLRAGQSPPTSVNCNGWSDIRVQTKPGADYPSHRPHYE